MLIWIVRYFGAGADALWANIVLSNFRSVWNPSESRACFLLVQEIHSASRFLFVSLGFCPMFDASSSEILDLSLLSTEMWLTEVFPFHNWNRQCWFFVLKNRQVWCLVKMCTITSNQRSHQSARVLFLCGSGWRSCGFIPISSSRSSTSSSRCRMLHWRRKSRLWPQRQSGEKLNAKVSKPWVQKKSWGCFKGTRFQRSWSTKWNDRQMLTKKIV